MPDRRFKDPKGTEWRVHVVITAPKVAPLQPPLSSQFRPPKAALVFESEHERRRLTPVPRGWEEAAPEELERLLAQAMTVTIRMGDNR